MGVFKSSKLQIWRCHLKNHDRLTLPILNIVALNNNNNNNNNNYYYYLFYFIYFLFFLLIWLFLLSFACAHRLRFAPCVAL